MRILLFSSVIALSLGLACQRPEVEAFKRRPTPVVVTFRAPGDTPQRQEVEKEYAAVLRNRLATRVVVVPEGVQPPPDAAQLIVEITDVYGSSRGASPAAVGVGTGIAVGTLSAMAGNRHAVFDGFFWGLFAGSVAADVKHARRMEERRLGYRPQRMNAVVKLVQPGVPEPLATFHIDGHEVVEAMDPIPGSARDDQARIREEEAKGFARVVAWKLQDHFGWMAGTEPRYYQAP